MPLTFPTKAEQIVRQFEQKEIKSLSAAARREAIEVEYEYPERTFVFDDDTQLIITGTGKNHKYRTELP